MKYFLSYGSAVWACLLSASVMAATVAEAEKLEKAGKFDKAARIYAELLKTRGGETGLRLSYADMLAKDKQWDAAVAQYRQVLQRSPDNKVALRSLGTVHRWRGDVQASLDSYSRASAVDVKDPDPVLGMAATYAMDHDYVRADATYKRALKQWPGNTRITREYEDFKTRSHPRVLAYFEDDLSFTSKEALVMAPLASRHEVGAGWHEEMSKNPSTENEVYTRTDGQLHYDYHVGHNHRTEFRARSSKFDYPVTPTAFSAIDKYMEYRLRYTFPVTLNQALSIRYTYRPTTLISGEEFDSHKVEGELHSRWTPRFRTVLGGGWLDDLDSAALTVDDTIRESLVRVEAQYDICHHIQLAGKYITNPDLDASVDSTTLLELGYDLRGPWSLMFRYRLDDYKKVAGQPDEDQNMFYAGVRFVPSAHLWSEVGLKHVDRGPDSGVYPLVSVVYHF